MYNMTTEYAAGFFDGEGSINIVRSKNSSNGRVHHALAVSVSQVRREPLDMLVEKYGGTVTTTRCQPDKNWRPAHRWNIRSQQAENFLRDIRPHLIVKAAEADIALEFRSIKAARGGRWENGPDTAAYEAREALKIRLEAERRTA